MASENLSTRLYESLLKDGATFGGKTDRASFDAMCADSTRMSNLYKKLQGRKGYKKIGSEEEFMQKFGTWQNAESGNNAEEQQAVQNAETKTPSFNFDPEASTPYMKELNNMSAPTYDEVKPQEEEKANVQAPLEVKTADTAKNAWSYSAGASMPSKVDVPNIDTPKVSLTSTTENPIATANNAYLEQMSQDPLVQARAKATSYADNNIKRIVEETNLKNEFKEKLSANVGDWIHGRGKFDTSIPTDQRPDRYDLESTINDFVEKSVNYAVNDYLGISNEPKQPWSAPMLAEEEKDMPNQYMNADGTPQTYSLDMFDKPEKELTEEEKVINEAINALSRQYANHFTQIMYDSFKEKYGTKDAIQYVVEKGLTESMVGRFASAIKNRLKGHPELADQLLSESREGFGENSAWYVKGMGAAAPLILDSAVFLGTGAAGNAVGEGLSSLIGRVGAKALGQAGAGFSTLSRGAKATNVLTRTLANTLPKFASGSVNFGLYDSFGTIADYIGDTEGKVSAMDIVKSGLHGAGTGAVLTAIGEPFRLMTKHATTAGKVIGDVTSKVAETAYFTWEEAKALNEAKGISFEEMPWTEIAFKTGTMLTVMSLSNPTHMMERYNGKSRSNIGFEPDKLDMDDVKNLNAIGIEGKTASEVFKNILNSGSYDKNEVSVNKKLSEILSSKELPFETKQKLGYIFTGQLRPYSVGFDKEGNSMYISDPISASTDAVLETSADGKGFAVRLKAENDATIKIKRFDNQHDAQAYLERITPEVQDNAIRMLEAVASKTSNHFNAEMIYKSESVEKALAKKPEDRSAKDIEILKYYIEDMSNAIHEATTDKRVVDAEKQADPTTGMVVKAIMPNGELVSVKGMDSNDLYCSVVHKDDSSEQVLKADLVETERDNLYNVIKRNVETYDPSIGAQEKNIIFVPTQDGKWIQMQIERIDKDGNVFLEGETEPITKDEVAQWQADKVADDKRINDKVQAETELANAQAQQKEEELNAPYWILDKKSGKYVPAKGEFIGSEFKLYDSKGDVIGVLKANEVKTREEAIAENEKLEKPSASEGENVGEETSATETATEEPVAEVPATEETSSTETPVTETPKQKTTASGIPIIEVQDGKKTKEIVDFSQSTPEQGHQHVYRRGAEMGDKVVAEMQKAASDALKKAQKAIEEPKQKEGESTLDYMKRLDEWDVQEKDTAAVEKAQKEVDYWNKVAEIESNRKVEEELRLAEEKEQKIREAKDRFETDDWTSEDLDTVFGEILPRLEGESDDAYQERLEAKANEDADAINRGERKNISGSYGKRASAAFDSIYGDAMNGIDGESAVQDLAEMYIADGNIKFGFDDLSNQLGKNNMTGEQRNRLFSMLTKNPRYTIESLSEHIAMEYNMMDRQTEIHSALVDAILKGRKGCVESLEEKATLEQVKPEDMETFNTPRMRKWYREQANANGEVQGEPNKLPEDMASTDDVAFSIKEEGTSNMITPQESDKVVFDAFNKRNEKGGIHDNGRRAEAENHYGKEKVSLLEKLAQKLGIKVVFQDAVNKGSANASMSVNGVMRVEIGNNNPLKWLVGHEFTHRMRKVLGEEGYLKIAKRMQHTIGEWDLAQAVMDYRKRVEEYNKYVKEHPEENLKEQKIDDNSIIEEVVADFYGDILTNTDVAERFLEGAPVSVSQAVSRMIRNVVDVLSNSEVDKATKAYLNNLKEVESIASNEIPLAEDREDATDYSIRTKEEPKKKGIGYKVFYRGKDGKLYPPMVANPNGADTPIGVWLDADAAPVVEQSKTGRDKVKAGGKGTQGGSGTLAYRPGWHLGEIPYALQFNRGEKVDAPNGQKNAKGEPIKVGKYFPKDFVWAEVEYANDVDYQDEAMSYGYNENGKFQHQLAGLPKLPVDGSYKYRTNANPATEPWIITGAMKVNRILDKSEVDELVRAAGREPQEVEPEEKYSINVKFYSKENPYHNDKKAQKDVLKRISDYIISQKYDKPGTDVIEFGNFAYVFDHANELGTYENLSDGDGFGIRAKVKISDATPEEIKILHTLKTDGRPANHEDINAAIAQIEFERYKNSGDNMFSQGRGTEVADGEVAAKNDGEKSRSRVGVQGNLGSSGENQTDVLEEKHSLKSSAKTYSKAIETGDEKVAREALDEYAKAKGYTIHAYHGTSRADRVGNVFRPERATSGPMAFFTSSKEIGDNYAKSKKDTSMAYDNDWVENDYHSQFKVNVGGYIGETRMEKAWGYLPFSLRSEITQKAAQARTDWEHDSRDIILDEKNSKGLGDFAWKLKESKGNAIKALLEEWLGSGTLYNDENRFMDVLDKTGVLDAFKQMGWTDAKFQDPNYTEPKTYDTFLKIEKPFDTNESYNDEFINGLENWWNNLSTRKKNSYDKESMEADHWDKNSMSVEEWIEKAREDKDGNTTWAWTTIPDAVTDYIKSLGHDGIIDQGGKGGGSAHSVYIPFKSEQIKSAELKTYDDEGNLIPLDKRFNKREDDIRFSLKVKKSDPFYSNAAKALEDIKQEKATGEQWIAMLKKNGGLKAEEDKWMGLSDWLTGKKGLTKQEVMQYIADNAIKIEEVSYNEFGREYEEYDNPMTVDNWVMFGKKDGYRNNLFFPDGNKISKTYVAETTHRKTGETVYVPKVNDQYVVGEDNWTPLYFKTPEEAQKAAVDEYNKKYSKGKRVNYVNEINGTRLRYTTEGLENNREIALTIPTIEPYKENDEIHFGDAGNGRAIAWLRFGDATTNRYRIDGEKAYEDYLHKLAEKYGDAALYDPAEYCTDEEVNELNSLFNAFNYKNYSQKGENGDKVLVIDEIQSKRHQDGREMGYKSEYENSARGKFQKATREIREFNKEMDSKYGEFHVLDNLTPEEQKRYQELYDAQTEASQYDTEQEKSYNVPDAPFQKTWHELAMKRALRYAAENGYDKIAWTTGEQQADRYDLSKTVGYISVYPAVDPITGERVEGKYDLFVRDRYHNTYPEASGLKTVKEIQEIIGKEVGSKLTSEADANGEQGAHVKGNDLKIGGDGMKGFYDKMLPSFMDKYGKKWGVKTQDIELDLPNKSDRIMHSIDVTEEMRKSVMEGQPKFSLKKGKDESYAEFAKRVEETYNNGKKREYDETNQGFFDFDDPNNDGDGTYQAPVGRTKKPNDTQLFLDFDNAPEEVKEVVKVSPIARGDKDVSNDDLTNTFGFVIKPGFTQKQRNDIYDSFVFMSETLGVSPKALSLGGALSLSMNNRLRSTIAQYRYFPSGKARGLEFGRGVVGDIAHEWTHALDNYLIGNQRTKAGDDRPYGTHMSDMTEEYLEGKGVRKEVVEAMKDIFKAMKDSGYNDKVAEYSKTIGNASYWKSTTEKLARCMETYMMQKEGSTKTLADVYRDYSKESVEGLYPNEEQMKTIAPAYDKFFATLEERTGDNGYPELYSLKNANAAKKRVDDMKKDIANMNLRIGAMGSSDKELKTLVADLTHYVNKNIDAQLATRLGSARIKAILSDIGKATSKKDLEQPVRDIQTMLGEAETEILFNKRSNLLNIDLQGKNQRGVAIAKHVDDDTRKALRNMGNNLNEDRVNYMTDFVKDGQDYADMLANGVEVPKELEQKMQISYPLRQLNLDVNEAKQALDQAKKDWEDAVNAIYQIKRAPGYMAQRNQARALAQAAQDVYLEKQKEYNLAINDFNEALGYVYGFGSNKLSAWKKAKADHKKELLKGVYGDVKRAHVLAEYENGGDDATRSTAQKAKDAWDSFNEKLGLPLHSLNYMLQMLDQNHANKMGYMYRTLFADPKRGIVHAADMMAEGKAAFGDAIEAKVNELFGIKKSKAFNTSAYAQLRQKSETEFIYDVTRRLNKDEAFQLGDVTREGEDITREKMSKGHALYLWLTWRQPDGKMKMIKQGYDQASVDDIEAKLGNEYIEFGKWVSDEFLPNLRKTKYNPRHIEMYGTSMAENPHYFPLKIDKGMVETFGEFGKPNDIVMPSTVAPNLIHRSNNVLPVDRNANAFDILKQYGEAMEQWHAMSPLIEDFNTIHASRIIKKAMDANRKGNFKMLMEAAQVATGSIYDNPNATDRVVNDVLNKAISRGARAAIGFRFMTAIKQLLSYPAFMTYSNSLRFRGELAANIASPKRFLYDNHKWAMETLPAYRQRSKDSDMGLEGMGDEFMVNKWDRALTKWGMIANRTVDKMTVAAGARAVYNEAIRQGKSHEEAVIEAEICYNESQQSSRNEFSSMAQKSGSSFLRPLMLFQNANISYAKQVRLAMWDIVKAMRDKDISAFDKTKIVRKSAFAMGMFGAILQGLWQAGGNTNNIVGLVQNVFDDKEWFGYLTEEEKRAYIISVITGLTTSGTIIGSPVNAVIGGFSISQNKLFDTVNNIAEAYKTSNAFDQKFFEKALPMILEPTLGISLRTGGNIYECAKDLAVGNPENGADIFMDMALLLNMNKTDREGWVKRLYKEYGASKFADAYLKASEWQKTNNKNREVARKYVEAKDAAFLKEMERLAKLNKKLESKDVPNEEKQQIWDSEPLLRNGLYEAYDDVLDAISENIKAGGYVNYSDEDIAESLESLVVEFNKRKKEAK